MFSLWWASPRRLRRSSRRHLPGLEDLRAAGLEVSVHVAEAQGAAEAFVTSASLFVMPVVEIDGLRIGDGRPGMETMALRKAYIDQARAAG